MGTSLEERLSAMDPKRRARVEKRSREMAKEMGLLGGAGVTKQEAAPKKGLSARKKGAR
jgi:hypothetical protein